jgi:glutamate dehydrogenase
MQAGIADDPYLSGELERYFPARWRKRFARAIAGHRLRTQLICTATTNSILNRMDPGFVQRLGVQTGASIGAVARAYTIARDAAGLRELWTALEELDLAAPAESQYEGMLASRDYVEQLTRRLLLGSAQREPGAIAVAVGRLEPAFRELRSLMPAALCGLARERYDAVHATHAVAGLPGPVCHWLAALPALRSAPDLARLAAEERRPLAQVTWLYFRVAQLLGVDWLGEAVRLLPTTTAWQGVARERLYTACLDAQRELCRKALRARLKGDAALERWPASLGAAGAQWMQTLRDLRSAQSPELAALMAGAESLRLLG